MKRVLFAGATFASIHVAVGIAIAHWGAGPDAQRMAPASATALSPVSATSAPAADEGFLYGRVTGEDGDVYEGRLRFGGDEEALWGNYFNGYKDGNSWLDAVPPGALREERRAVEIFGLEFSVARRPEVGRPMMARFGDIARMEARGRDLTVTLRSGTVYHLDRYAADDYADGVRVWDARRGVVDLNEREIRSIEFLPTPRLGALPAPLYGTVRTRQGEFSGFVQWDRKAALESDELLGQTAEGELRLRFDVIQSIERRSPAGALVRTVDGREIVLNDTGRDGRGNRGLYVDDPRYGRVLVSWQAFERIDFSRGGAAPAYRDFRPGHALTGTVTTRTGRRLAGRLIYDLDESETTETLDAPAQGVDYTIPFGLIASIVPDGNAAGGPLGALVTLHSGEAMELERTGDLADSNAGLLVFVGGRQRAEYVPWADVAKIEMARAPAGGR